MRAQDRRGKAEETGNRVKIGENGLKLRIAKVAVRPRARLFENVLRRMVSEYSRLADGPTRSYRPTAAGSAAAKYATVPLGLRPVTVVEKSVANVLRSKT